jgi:hypothetical protein
MNCYAQCPPRPIHRQQGLDYRIAVPESAYVKYLGLRRLHAESRGNTNPLATDQKILQPRLSSTIFTNKLHEAAAANMPIV